MIVYSLLLATLLLAAFRIYCLRPGLRLQLYRLLPATLLAVFIYLYGAWVFLSVYCRYVFALAFAVALVCQVAKSGAGSRAITARGTAINIVFIILLSILDILYYIGTTGIPETVNLAFPFRHGRYYVFQGDKGLPTNLFHFGYRGAVYAMDIIKLNDVGNRANHIFSTQLTDYAVFGDTVYSPCRGLVLKSFGAAADNVPPARTRGPGASNQVLIGTDEYYIFLGHLRQKGVFVHEGDTVRVGQPLGLAGNSGFSIELHLHIQVHKRTYTSLPWYRESPLYILFGGKSYLLFQQIDAMY